MRLAVNEGDGVLLPLPCQPLCTPACFVCRADSVSPQTRSSALVLLSTMAALLPERVLTHLMPVFQFMGATALAREDSYTFFIVQKA